MEPKRVGDWLQTYTGAAFFPLDPHPEDIRFADIAASISKMCRYAGHCIKFYSVAEHSCHIADLAPDALKLTALMHDASEAYLVDIPRPLKPYLVGYREIEEKLEQAISHRFALQFPLPKQIKELDNRIVADERLQNMAPPAIEWTPRDPLGVTLKFWTPAQAKYEFTTRFYRFGGRD